MSTAYEQSSPLLVRYYNEIKDIPLLTVEEEVTYANLVKASLYPVRSDGRSGNEIIYKAPPSFARDMLWKSNLRYVVKMAMGFGPPNGISTKSPAIMDVIQDGNMGLLRAVEKFDPNEGYRFTTYATAWIWQAMQKSVRNMSCTVRRKTWVWEAIARLRKARRFLGEDASARELSQYLGISEEKVEEFRKAEQSELSLEYPLKADDEGSDTFGDILSSDEKEEFIGDTSDEHAVVMQFFEMLDDRHEDILRRRFGVGYNDRVYTLDEVGRDLGITRERVRQLQNNALDMLRDTTFYEQIESELSD